MFLSRSVDEKPLYDRILLMLFSSTFAIEESELRILFCQWSNINFMFRCLGIKLPPWRTLETNSNTIIKLLEDEKRLRWKFNGRVFVVGRDLHLHYPLGSLPSPRSNQRHRTSHKNEIHHIRPKSEPRTGDHQPCVLPGASYRGERNNNHAKRRKGRW